MEDATSLSKETHNEIYKEVLIWFLLIFTVLGFIFAVSYFLAQSKRVDQGKIDLKENTYIPQYLNENNIFYQFEHKGMKVLLINPKNQSTKSQLASSVGVGSSSDENFIGFTHFIEHMLFTGSKKFDDEEGLN